MFLETFIHIGILFLSDLTEAHFLSRNGGVTNNYHINSYSAMNAFYSFPLEIRENIKSKFIELTKLESSRKYEFDCKLHGLEISMQEYAQELDHKESKFAYDEDVSGDRFVRAEFFTGEPKIYYPNSPHYYLTLGRCGIGVLRQLSCKQKEISLVTFKDDIIKAYYKRDNQEGYDVQVWPVGKKKIDQFMNKIDCLTLVLIYHCFDFRNLVEPIPARSPWRKIYEYIPADIKKKIFIDEKGI